MTSVISYTDHHFSTSNGTMKIFVVLLLLLAIGSLGSGLFFLMRDKGQTNRTAKALTWRIGISITAFLLIMVGWYFGFIPVHGVQP